MAVFRVAKTKDYTVMTNHHLRNVKLSLKAKGLQSLMLSLPERWDYTTKGLSKICKDGIDGIRSALNELESHGYLTRRRIRDETGRLCDIEYTIHEQPIEAPPPVDKPVDNHVDKCVDSTVDNLNGTTTSQQKHSPPNPVSLLNTAFPPEPEKPMLENPVLAEPKPEKPVLDKPMLGNPEQASPMLEIPIQSNTITNQELNKSIIHISNIDPSIHPSIQDKKEKDTMDAIDCYRQLIKDNVEYESLSKRLDCERLDELIEIILETVISRRKTIRVAGDEFSAQVVKSRFLKLNANHIEYVLESLKTNATKIHNIKSYLITALYNAPATIQNYYRAEVNHDFYGS